MFQRLLRSCGEIQREKGRSASRPDPDDAKLYQHAALISTGMIEGENNFCVFEIMFALSFQNTEMGIHTTAGAVMNPDIIISDAI